MVIGTHFRGLWSGPANRFLSPDVGTQDLRYGDGAISLLAVLKDRNEAAGRRHGGRIQRVREEFVTADFAGADVEPPLLVVRAVAAADYLSVVSLPREPGLDVVLLCRYGADVPRTDIHDPIRDLKSAVDRLAVRSELLVPRPAVLGSTENELLDLVELMHAEQAFRVDAVPADLPSETRTRAGQRDWQAALLEDLIHEHRAHRVLRRRDEVEVLAFDLVHDVLEVREVRHAFVRLAAHEERREDGGEALLHHEVHRERQQCLVQPHQISEEEQEAGACDLPGPLEIREAQGFEELAVGLEFEVRAPRCPPACNLHVLRIVLSHRNALVEDVR